MKLAKFKTNQSLEQDGIWQDVADGLRIKVARIGNPRYKAYVRRMGKAQMSMARATGDMDLDVLDALTVKALAKFVLLDWEGLEDDEGTAIPFSPEKAHELLTDVPDFRALVEGYAGNAQLFRDQELDETVENSSSHSTG